MAALSPLLLDYGPGDPLLREVIFGAVIGFLAYLRAAGAARTPLLSWASVALGAGLFAAGILLAARPPPALNESIAGGVICLLALTGALNARDVG